MNLQPEDIVFIARVLIGGSIIVALMARVTIWLQLRADRQLEREQIAARYRDAEAGETR